MSDRLLVTLDDGTRLLVRLEPETSLATEAEGVKNELVKGGLDVARLAGSFGDFLTGPIRQMMPQASKPLFSPDLPQAEDVLKDVGILSDQKPETMVGKLAGGVARAAPSIAIPGGTLATRAATSLGAGIGSGIADAGDLGETGQAIGGVLGSFAPAAAARTATRIAPSLAEWGQANKLSSLGLTKGELKRSLQKDPRGLTEEARVQKAIEQLAEEGSIVPGKPAQNLTRVESELETLFDAREQLAKAADRAQVSVKAVNTIPVRYPLTEAYIQKEVPTELRAAAKAQLDEIRKVAQRTNFKVSEWLADAAAFSRQGKNTLGQSGGDEIAANIRKFAGRDIADSIKTELKKPKYLEVRGPLLESERKIADRMAVSNVLRDADAAASTIPLDERLRAMAGTTGVLAAPTALLTAAFGPVGGALGLGTIVAARSPAGRQAIGRALERAARPIERAGRTIPQSVAFGPLAQQIMNLREMDIPEMPQDMAAEIPEFALNAPQLTPSSASASPVNDIVLDAVRMVESSGGKNLVSPAGALGPYQLMPATAKALGVKDPFDEEESREGARRHLEEDLEFFGGDLELALAAYNLGRPRLLKRTGWEPGMTFEDIKDKLPKETREYVPKVQRAKMELMS